MMQATVHKNDAYTVIEIEGVLDNDTYPECARVVDPVLAENNLPLILDLSNLTYLSSSGLRILFKARKILVAQGKTLLITKPCETVSKVIRITNAIPEKVIYPSLTDALAHINLNPET